MVGLSSAALVGVVLSASGLSRQPSTPRLTAAESPKSPQSWRDELAQQRHLNAPHLRPEWGAATPRVLGLATGFCVLDGKCTGEDLEGLRDAWQARAHDLDATLRLYGGVEADLAADDDGDAWRDGAWRDVSGATSEARALRHYLAELRRDADAGHRAIQDLDAEIARRGN
ncbi:hypothetical protein M885DRAFT_587418 [Pelagophyceae sp. CCMP2097]|nr:hypothetical protein M885DRAFT_587418 [Pelagophyceae sp. CCMP2097]